MSSIATCEKFLSWGDGEWDAFMDGLENGAPVQPEHVECAEWLTGKTSLELSAEGYFSSVENLLTDIKKHRYRDAY